MSLSGLCPLLRLLQSEPKFPVLPLQENKVFEFEPVLPERVDIVSVFNLLDDLLNLSLRENRGVDRIGGRRTPIVLLVVDTLRSNVQVESVGGVRVVPDLPESFHRDSPVPTSLICPRNTSGDKEVIEFLVRDGALVRVLVECSDSVLACGEK